MANVQAVSPIGQLPGSGGMSRRSPAPRSQYGSRSPTHYGSRPNSRVSFSDGSARAHSRQNSGGRIPRPPSQPRGSPDGSSGLERPPSVRSLHEKVDMSEFLSPAVKTAVRRWKRFHEEKVREKYKERRNSKRVHTQTVKEEKKKLARKIPIDVLALEWMKDNRVTVDARAYLLEKLLPTLILGVEKLLMEVDKRNLAEETEVNPNFNPINYLAQYLMRNNPKYSNFPEASPYIRGLHEVTDELKNHVFSFEDNRLAKVKAEARRKREEQVKQEALRTQERLARSGRIREHFTDWILDEENEVETHIIHSALKNFKEVLDELPPQVKKGVNFADQLRPINKEKLEVGEFVEYLRGLISKMTPELFHELMQHMSQCAQAYRRSAVLEARKDILMALFKNCDHASIGIIDRHRVLGLFRAFYDKQAWVMKRHIRNPRRWPVVELDEVGDDESSIAEDSNVSVSSMSGSIMGSRVGSPQRSPSPPMEKAKDESAVEEVDQAKQMSEESVAQSEEKAAEPSEESKPVEESPAADDATKESDDTETPAATEGTEEKQQEGVAGGAEGGASEQEALEEKKDEGGETAAGVDAERDEKSPSSTDAPKESTESEQKYETKPSEDVDKLKGAESNGDEAKTAQEAKQVAEPATDNVPKSTEETVGEVPGVKVEDMESKALVIGKDKQESDGKVAEESEKNSPEGIDTEKPPADESKENPESDEKKDLQEEGGKKDEQAEGSENVKEKDEKVVKEEKSPDVSPATDTENAQAGLSDEAPTGGDEEKKEEVAEDEEKKEEVAIDEEEKKDEGPADEEEKKEEVTTGEHEKLEEASTGDQEKNDEVPSGEQEKKDEDTSEEAEKKDGEPDQVPDEDDKQSSHPQTAATGRATAVSFNEEALATKEKKKGLKFPVKTPTSRSGSVAASAFDQNTLNTNQFVQLVEVFLGEEPPEEVVQSVIKFIQDGYVETEEEKFNRLQKARREEQVAKRKVMMDQLFDKWDNDGSGFLDLDELHSVMSKFKENMEKKIVAKAKQMLDKEDNDHRLSKTEFKRYLEVVCSLLPGGEDNFDPLVEFLVTSVERSYEERIRGQARKKWLSQIQQAAETSGASMEPVYKSVFNSLYKDSDQHGRGKRISANVAMLERNDSSANRGPTCLRYVASTPDDGHFMLNRILYRDMKGISFTSVDSGKPIHVPRVQNHGNIMFWNPERQEFYFKKSIDEYDPNKDQQGSFIVIPLKDHRKRVFGTMGIDTLNDPQEKNPSIIILDEISFFQGVAKAFSSAYQYVDIRRKTLRIAESAVAWIHRRSPHVAEISVYIVEPDDKDFNTFQSSKLKGRNRKMAKYIEDEVETIKLEDFILRRMLTTDKAGNIEQHDHPTKLERKENLFRDYLFRCVDNSETITADAYGQRHTAFPLRDVDGHCVALVDISIGELKQLPGHENKEVQRMLKLLQYAHKEVSLESEGKDQKVVLEAEKQSEESRIDIMFDRIMLTDLRETVGKLNLRAFAELKSYKEPPQVIHNILASVLSIFYSDKAEAGELEEYNNCKQYVNQDLINKIEEFDPTALEVVGVVNRIAARLKEVPHGAVAKHGSLPAQHLYNWAFVCLSLLEHTSKMKLNQKQPLTDNPPPGSAMSGGVTEQ